jgi:glycosyltransferase involved in cell wall biosynthesis
MAFASTNFGIPKSGIGLNQRQVSKYPMPLHRLKADASPPLVSIITPTFNHEDFIGSCIESVLSQTYQNWELIIIDDGSTDQTRIVIQDYTDRRIRYLYQENQGIEALPQTYNRALKAAGGSLIAILEGDDLWPSNKLEMQISGFQDEQVVLAYGIVGETSADGLWAGQLTRSVRRNRKLPSPILSNSPVGSATVHLLANNDLIPPSTAIMRRSALEAIGGFQHMPGLCVTDFPTFLRLSLEGKFCYTRKITGFRRRHLRSVSFNNIETISAAAYQQSLNFINQHRLRLTVSEQRRIDESWRRGMLSHAFVDGRYKLIQRDWKNARRSFLKAADLAEPRVLAAAVFGWSMSWLRCDLEWAFRISGRAVIKQKHSPTLGIKVEHRVEDSRALVTSTNPEAGPRHRDRIPSVQLKQKC